MSWASQIAKAERQLKRNAWRIDNQIKPKIRVGSAAPKKPAKKGK